VNRYARLVAMQARLPRDYERRAELVRAVAEEGVGGVLLFGGDLARTPGFLRSLREAARGPLLVLSDVERGVGQQVEGMLRLPPPMAAGAAGDEAAARAMGAATARDCRAVGIDVALAPVLDLAAEPRNPIVGPRSFGVDPALVARLGAAWIEGCQAGGVLACAKHFPGHGRTLLDSHDALPVVEAGAAALRESDLVPFRRAVEAGVATLMTAHVAYPGLDPAGGATLPATLSAPVLTDLLRKEMGFGGLLMSDALLMEGVRKRRGGETAAAVDALRAGCDLLLCPTDPLEVAGAVAAAVRTGIVSRERADEALARVEAATVAAERGPAPGAPPGMDAEGAVDLVRRSLTALRDRAGLLPLRPGARTMAVVLDDDDRPGREAPALERLAALRARWFVVRASDLGSLGRDLLDLACGAAERVLVFLYGDLRARKGRPGLVPGLAALAAHLEDAFRDRAVLLAFGGPALAGAEGPGTAVCAYDDAPEVQRAALDHLLSGGDVRK